MTGLICQRCHQHNPLKSNIDIVAEADRLSAYLHERPLEPSCPHEECPNHDVGISAGPKAYTLFGHTNAGSQRYTCKACGRRFTVSRRATLWQHRPDKNKSLFLALVNHGSLKRIFEQEETGGGALYSKLEYFYAQCRAFASEVERRFLEKSQVGFHRLYLSTDAQEYVLNWKFHENRMNVKLSAIGTADNDSGYVFGMNLNFDPNAVLAEKEAEAAPDAGKPEPYRKHARFWLKDDYLKSLARSAKRAKRRVRPTKKEPRSLIERIRFEAREAGRRYNVERTEEMHKHLQLPDVGVQTQKDYTAYGHYMFLKRLFADNFGKLRFFFDYDSGLRSACLAAFQREVVDERVDAAYVALTYGLTKPAKLIALAKAKKAFEAEAAKHPGAAEHEVKMHMMLEQIAAKESDQFWGDWWIRHPLPSMAEPQKMMSIQTNTNPGRFDDRHLANLLLKGSLHGVNRFFNVVRKRLAALDRQTASASTQRREYLVYGLYNPKYMVMLLEILRVYYNYALPVQERHGKLIPKKDRQTPAQYLGIVDRTYTVDEIMEFVPTPAPRRKEEHAISA
jgi:hypothetical protein